MRGALIRLLVWTSCSLALVTPNIPAVSSPLRLDDRGYAPYNSSIRPLVLWHGLGDRYDSPGMTEFAEMIQEVHPGIFVHNVWVDEDSDKDQKAGFFGHVETQLEFVNEQLKSIPELEKGFDAIGFSQGGQFLRAYTEIYNSPRVYNLLTFGSQHMGVSDLPLCRPSDVVWCFIARSAARRGVYTAYAQRNIIQAQYFRDHMRLDAYRRANTFLTSINGENKDSEEDEERTKRYKENFESLENLVMVLFDKDRTVVPKESSWFGSYAPPSDESKTSAEPPTILPMRQQPLYQEDWIGLRKLDESGRVHLVSCDGEHMQIAYECWHPLVEKFAGAVLIDIPPLQKEIPLLRIQS